MIRICPECKKKISKYSDYCSTKCADKQKKKNPYLLKIKTLNRKYCDPVELILQANFQILVDFVEGEKPEEVVNWDSDSAHAHARNEFKGLYFWWKKGRPKAWKLYNTLLSKAFKKFSGFPIKGVNKPALDAAHDLEILLEAKDQKNLHRLIEIRNFLWT